MTAIIATPPPCRSAVDHLDDPLTAAYLLVLEADDDVELALSAVAAAEQAHTAAEQRREAAIARYALLDSAENAAERLAIPLSAVRAAVRRSQQTR